MIDWQSSETHILLNPRLPPLQQTIIKNALPRTDDFDAHFWLATSGSTAKSPYDYKFAALSKEAVLASAAAVNRHLEVTHGDKWLMPLPQFHVGGLGILARAHLSGSSVVSLEKWDPQSFHDLIAREAVSLTSLVPAQVFDLVTRKLISPKSLRAVIVGGGALSPSLQREAALLGWPLLPSYGLTECCSQVATAQPGQNHLRLLSHIEARITEENTIALKSPSLLTAYGFLNEEGMRLQDPKIEGWFVTQDCGEIQTRCLQIKGRKDDFIKIGGESVLLSRLEALFEQAKLSASVSFDAAIFAMPDQRLGHVIHLAATSNDFASLFKAYNESVLPFERIRKVHLLPELPRSPLKKLLVSHLLQITV